MGQARDTMNRVTEAIFSKDSEAIKNMYTPDAVMETPDQGPVRGRDAIAAYLGEFIAAFPDASYETAYEHESGDNAIDEGFLVGTHTGPLAGPDGESIAPTGKAVRHACLRRRQRQRRSGDPPPPLLRSDGLPRTARTLARIAAHPTGGHLESGCHGLIQYERALLRPPRPRARRGDRLLPLAGGGRPRVRGDPWR